MIPASILIILLLAITAVVGIWTGFKWHTYTRTTQKLATALDDVDFSLKKLRKDLDDIARTTERHFKQVDERINADIARLHASQQGLSGRFSVLEERVGVMRETLSQHMNGHM